MEAKYPLSIGLILSLGYILLGVTTIQTVNYYCEDTKIAANCLALSSSGITCYTQASNTGGKRCSTIWQKISNDKKIENKGIYTKCKSGSSEAYYGEKFVGNYTGGTFIGEADGKTWICK